MYPTAADVKAPAWPARPLYLIQSFAVLVPVRSLIKR
jgi:hypothetical protein